MVLCAIIRSVETKEFLEIKKMSKSKKITVKSDDVVKKAVQIVRGMSSLPRSADVMANLNKTLQQHGLQVTPQPKGKQDRWEMVLSPEMNAVAKNWVEAKTVYDSVLSRLENTKAQLSEYAEGQMIDKIFENKSRPSNPQIVINDSDGKVDHQFIFIFQDKFKVEFKKMPENADPVDFFKGLFVSLGLSQSNASDLVNNELDFNPVTGIRGLSELLDGHYGAGREWFESSLEEKTAGAKLSALLMWDGTTHIEALTPQEKATVVKTDPGVVVKTDFYARVASYCETAEQLSAVFAVIKPIAYPSHVKFAIGDSDVKRTQRKISAASDIMTRNSSDDTK